jgi:uncharacterized protein YecT (DUF1311 family)
MNSPIAPCRGVASTVAMYNCFAKAFDRADGELNRVYDQIQSVLQPEDQKRILVAQRIWLQYRDATCSAERGLYEGGTGGPPTEVACREALTRERIDVLKTTYGWRLEKFSK